MNKNFLTFIVLSFFLLTLPLEVLNISFLVFLTTYLFLILKYNDFRGNNFYNCLSFYCFFTIIFKNLQWDIYNIINFIPQNFNTLILCGFLAVALLGFTTFLSKQNTNKIKYANPESAKSEVLKKHSVKNLYPSRIKSIQEFKGLLDKNTTIGLQGSYGFGKSYFIDCFFSENSSNYYNIKISMLDYHEDSLSGELFNCIISHIEEFLDKEKIFSFELHKLSWYFRFKNSNDFLSTLIFKMFLGSNYYRLLKNLTKDLNKLKKGIVLVIDDLDRIIDENTLKKCISLLHGFSDLGNNFKVIFLYHDKNLLKIEDKDYLLKFIPNKFHLPQIEIKEILDEMDTVLKDDISIIEESFKLLEAPVSWLSYSNMIFENNTKKEADFNKKKEELQFKYLPKIEDLRNNIFNIKYNSRAMISIYKSYSNMKAYLGKKNILFYKIAYLTSLFNHYQKEDFIFSSKFEYDRLIDNTNIDSIAFSMFYSNKINSYIKYNELEGILLEIPNMIISLAQGKNNNTNTSLEEEYTMIKNQLLKESFDDEAYIFFNPYEGHSLIFKEFSNFIKLNSEFKDGVEEEIEELRNKYCDLLISGLKNKKLDCNEIHYIIFSDIDLFKWSLANRNLLGEINSTIEKYEVLSNYKVNDLENFNSIFNEISINLNIKLYKKSDPLKVLNQFIKEYEKEALPESRFWKCFKKDKENKLLFLNELKNFIRNINNLDPKYNQAEVMLYLEKYDLKEAIHLIANNSFSDLGEVEMSFSYKNFRYPLKEETFKKYFKNNYSHNLISDIELTRNLNKLEKKYPNYFKGFNLNYL